MLVSYWPNPTFNPNSFRAISEIIPFYNLRKLGIYILKIDGFISLCWAWPYQKENVTRLCRNSNREYYFSSPPLSQFHLRGIHYNCRFVIIIMKTEPFPGNKASVTEWKVLWMIISTYLGVRMLRVHAILLPCNTM